MNIRVESQDLAGLPNFAELLRDDAGKGVERAAGRERDHQADGPVRIGLRGNL
jgi:hypothetical protein